MQFHNEIDQEAAMYRLIDYYYDNAPGTIMPLYLLYLARTSNRGEVRFRVEEKVRDPLSWEDNPEGRFISPILSQFTRDDVKELMDTDQAGVRLLNRLRCKGTDHLSIVIPGEADQTNPIRTAFQKHDFELGESTRSRLALFFFVKGLIRMSPDTLKESYLEFAQEIISRSGIFGKADTIEKDLPLARFERWVAGDVSGTVFAPFASTPMAAAMMNKNAVITESSGKDASLAAMVSELLISGNGGKDAVNAVAGKPYETMPSEPLGLVLLNHMNFTGKDTAFHRCLKLTYDKLSESGKFIGVIDCRSFFQMVEKQKLFMNILANDHIEAIIMLPSEYRAMLIVVNKAKKKTGVVQLTDLYNIGTDFYPNIFKRIIARNTRKIPTETLAREESRLCRYFEKPEPSKPGFKLVRLGKFLRNIPRESSFSASDANDISEEPYTICIDRTKPYNPFDYQADSCQMDVFSIYSPSYFISTDALLVNEKGPLEARFYDHDRNPDAYFFDGLAFAIDSTIYPPYIINELRKPYVLDQLNHWQASADMIHSEDEIMELSILVPDCEDSYEKEANICSRELNAKLLPEGFHVFNQDDLSFYEIICAFDPGGFGNTYKALRKSYSDDDERIVVLKEYFAKFSGSQRDGNMRISINVPKIASIRSDNDAYAYLVKFIDEGEAMRFFNRYENSRIRKAYSIFSDTDTNTYYYVSDYFEQGDLAHYMNNHREEMSEETIIENIMKPVARGLSLMHSQKWLHLDIKPANIMIDDDGFAVIGDLGISQHYGENGEKMTKGSGLGTGGYACPLQYNEQFTQSFHPELDVYSFAAMYFELLSGRWPDNYNQRSLDRLNCSIESKEAIKTAMDKDLKTTPKTAVEFMRMLPGCADYDSGDFVLIQKEDDDTSGFGEWDTDDYDFIDELPDFSDTEN